MKVHCLFEQSGTFKNAFKNYVRVGNVDKVTGIINALRLAGHEDAAAYLESKKEV